MSKRFIFKFRDDLALPSHSTLKALLTVPSGYFKALQEFVKDEKPELPPSLEGRIKELSILLNKIVMEVKSNPLFLYGNSSLETFFLHKEALRNRGKGNYQMPNFYLWFEYILPDNFSEKMLGDFISELSKFLMLESDKQVEDTLYLLDYAYIKEDAVPAMPPTFTFGPRIIGKVGHRNHLDELNLPANTIFNENTKDTSVFVIEKGGWNANHSEFKQVRNRITRIGETSSLITYNRDDILMNNDESDGNEHGTKTLGILMSPLQNTNPDCVGILPPKANVILSSCSTYLGKGQQTKIQYSEHGALKRILDYFNEYSREGNFPNWVILFEIEASGNLPITTDPALCQLIRTVAELGCTIVIPAGNNSNSPELKKDTLQSKLRKLTNSIKAFQLFEETKEHVLFVGAAYPGKEDSVFSPYKCNWSSEYIPIYAQGSSVLTTSYKSSKYDIMEYTSAASAIIAGVVALLQTYAFQRLNRTLTTSELKKILYQGTPVNKENSLVGFIPDVKVAIERIDEMQVSSPT